MAEHVPSFLGPPQGQVANQEQGGGGDGARRNIKETLDDIAEVLRDRYQQLDVELVDGEQRDHEQQISRLHDNMNELDAAIKCANKQRADANDLKRKTRDLLLRQRDKYRQERDEARQQRDRYKQKFDDLVGAGTQLLAQRENYRQQLQEAREVIGRLTGRIVQDPISP